MTCRPGRNQQGVPGGDQLQTVACRESSICCDCRRAREIGGGAIITIWPMDESDYRSAVQGETKVTADTPPSLIQPYLGGDSGACSFLCCSGFYTCSGIQQMVVAQRFSDFRGAVAPGCEVVILAKLIGLVQRDKTGARRNLVYGCLDPAWQIALAMPGHPAESEESRTPRQPIPFRRPEYRAL